MRNHAEMNHAVEEFIWQMGLEVKDRKEEVIQEAVTTVQTTENKSRNWSDVATSQGMPRATRTRKRQGTDAPLKTVQGVWPC